MHAHDRTLLSSLGFADPDRGDWLHDMACQYLIQPETRERVMDRLAQSRFGGDGELTRAYVKPHRLVDVRLRYLSDRPFATTDAHLERPLSKGVDRYRTTVGFLDAEFRASGTLAVHGANSGQFGGYKDVYFYVTFEVKVFPIAATTLIRQVNLYREYAGTNRWWVAVTRYPMTETDKNTLLNENIYCLHLGPDFVAWAEARRREVDGLGSPS